MKILGLDLGSNSIGWAIRDTETQKITGYGSKIFEEGIRLEKGIPASKTAERTSFRGMRRGYFRRKLRKFETLKILIEYGYVPLSIEELRKWLKPEKKQPAEYPNSKEFRNWIRLDFNNDGIPDYEDIYELRAMAADPANKLSPYEIGRIFYAFAQRRGFLSNRKSQSANDDESGMVKSEIAQYDKLIQDSTLGVIMHEKMLNNEKLRGIHFGRKQLIAEFEKICENYYLDKEFHDAIYKALFYQRPLKSQKMNIGYCTFEPKKHRCPISHFQFEQFRMLQFINSIKVKVEKEDQGRQLGEEERQLIYPLFYRKSKVNFDFKEIKDKINKKNKKDKLPELIFNYRDKATVSGCPTIASIISVLGEEYWYSLKDENQKNADNERMRSEEEAVKGEMSKETIWNVLFFYDDDEKLIEWAKNKLNLDDEQAKAFAKIHLKDGYASLSLKAIRNILPFLNMGLIFSHAVFLANCKAVIGEQHWNADKNEIIKDLGDIIDKRIDYIKVVNIINSQIKHALSEEAVVKTNIKEEEAEKIRERVKNSLDAEYPGEQYGINKLFYDNISFAIDKIIKGGHAGFISSLRTDELIKQYLQNRYNQNGDYIGDDDFKKLYHPSDLDVFKEPVRDKNNRLKLAKPEIEAIKNPIFNRAMYELKKLLDSLIDNKKDENRIDENTRIHVEFGRDLNSINQRIAIENWQRNRERDNAKYIQEIKDLYFAETKSQIEPTKDDLVKYRLWLEQNKKCIYTGKEIGISDLFNNDKFEIEHTIPRSKTLDNSLANKTICDANYNRHTKGNHIPHELPNYEKSAVINGIEYPPIMETVNIIYKSVLLDLKDRLDSQKKKVKAATTKEQKDNGIRQKEITLLNINYYKSKIGTFELEKVNEGFKPSQGADISSINRYAAMYLKTLFKRVVVFQSSMLKQFKTLWDVETPDLRKDRTNHVHHAIDAAVLTFIDRNAYNALADYYKAEEKETNHIAQIVNKPPFEGFAAFMKNMRNELLVKYSVKDYALKNTKRKFRKLGKIQYRPVYKKDEHGNEILDGNNRKIPEFLTDAQGNIIVDSHNKPKIKYETDSKGNRIPLYSKGEGVRLSMFKQTYYGAIQKDMEIKYVIRMALNSAKFSSIKDLDKIVDPVIRESVITQINAKMQSGMSFAEAIDQDYYQNEDLKIPLKKVRCFVASVSNPLVIKQHMVKSGRPSSEYKKNFYVVNDGNYMTDVFDKLIKNKKVRDSYTFSAFDVANLKKQSISHLDVLKHCLEGIEYEYIGTLKKGTLVLFYENSEDEILWNNKADIMKRLYEVTDLANNSDKRIRFKFHQEARSDIKLKEDLQKQYQDKFEKTLVSGKSAYEYSKSYSRLHIKPFNFKFLIEGVHFKQNDSGDIIKL